MSIVMINALVGDLMILFDQIWDLGGQIAAPVYSVKRTHLFAAWNS